MEDQAARTTTTSEYIRGLRVAIGEQLRGRALSQEEFARLASVTVSTVNRWENKHATPQKLAWVVIEAAVQRIRKFASSRGVTLTLPPNPQEAFLLGQEPIELLLAPPPTAASTGKS